MKNPFKLNGCRALVLQVLLDSPDARDDDRLLIIRVWRAQGCPQDYASALYEGFNPETIIRRRAELQRWVERMITEVKEPALFFNGRQQDIASILGTRRNERLEAAENETEYYSQVFGLSTDDKK